MTRVAVALVRLYRGTLGPVLAALDGPPLVRRCKYEPSCSQYAIDAVRAYGLLRGAVLAAWRLVRCNPWSHGGVDHACDQRLFQTPGRAA